MAASVSVVTSNRCGMPYMVRHGETGYLVNSLDTNEIARRMGRLIEDVQLRQVMEEMRARLHRNGSIRRQWRD